MTLPSFQQYQIQFTHYLRDPKSTPLPGHVSKKRMQVYATIVFNNLTASISACFPVLSQCLGERKWRALTREFMRSYPSASPIFRDIPEQFLHFLQQLEEGFRLGRWRYPAYIQVLAHYEWVELSLSSKQADIIHAKSPSDWLQEVPYVNPVLENLVYPYPVHTIGPTQPSPALDETYLLVFRTAQFEIKFIETNAITHRLIALLLSDQLTGQALFMKLALELGYPDADALTRFGVDLLQSLYEQHVIIGVHSASIGQ